MRSRKVSFFIHFKSHTRIIVLVVVMGEFGSYRIRCPISILAHGLCTKSLQSAIVLVSIYPNEFVEYVREHANDKKLFREKAVSAVLRLKKKTFAFIIALLKEKGVKVNKLRKSQLLTLILSFALYKHTDEFINIMRVL